MVQKGPTGATKGDIRAPALSTCVVVNGKMVPIDNKLLLQAHAMDALNESLLKAETSGPSGGEASAMISRAVGFALAHNSAEVIGRLIRNTMGGTDDIALDLREGQPLLMRLTSPIARFSTAHALIACEVQVTVLCTVRSPTLDPRTVRVFLCKMFRQEIMESPRDITSERTIDVSKVMRISSKPQSNSPLTATHSGSSSSTEETLTLRPRSNSYLQQDNAPLKTVSGLLPKSHSDCADTTGFPPMPPLPSQCTVPLSPLDVGLESKNLLKRKAQSFCLKPRTMSPQMVTQSPALSLDSQEILLFENVAE